MLLAGNAASQLKRASAAANISPVALDDTVNITANNSVLINVLANDTDADGTINAGSVLIVTQPLSGTAVANLDGTITYTPNANFSGTDSFTYTVNDTLGATSNTATVTVTVVAPNVAPVAVNDTYSTNVGVAVIINVIANDTDADGAVNPASVIMVSQPANGTAVANADGTVTYTPNAGFNGTDTFTYTVSDILGATSNNATVTVTVVAPNVAPEIITVTTALFRRIGARWIISGTDNAYGSVLTIRIEGGAQLGTAKVSALGIWSFTARNSTIIPAPGDRLSIESSNGAVLRNVPITIRD